MNEPGCACACEPEITKGYRVSDGARVAWKYCPECWAEGDMFEVGGVLLDE